MNYNDATIWMDGVNYNDTTIWMDGVNYNDTNIWMDGVKVALGNRGMTVEAARQ